MGSRALPMIGRLLGPVGIGFAAFEVCNAIMNGCLSFSDDGGSGLPAQKWEWTNRALTQNPGGGIAESHAMVFTDEKGAWTYAGDAPEGCAVRAIPQGVTGWGPKTGTGTCNKGVGCPCPVPHKYAERWPDTWHVDVPATGGSTTLGTGKYCRGWGAEDNCQNGPDTAGWSKAAAQGLQTHMPPEVGQWVASEIPGSGVKSPYVSYVTVPENLCEGMKYPACVVEVEELELVPTQTELDWDDAVIEELDELDPQKTREEEEEKVITIIPGPGTELEVGSELEVITNPSEEDMPQWVPKPDPGETEEEYRERKLALPFWIPEGEMLSDGTLDPSKGPNEVVRTTPKAGSKLDPHPAGGTQTVTVTYNPPTAPEPSATPWSAPSIRGIDFGPLTGIAIGCNKFPFGVFCWIGDGLAGVGSAGSCPTIGVPMGSSVGLSEELVFDLCMFEPAMVVIRPILVLLSALCLAYMFAAAAMGFGGGSNED